MLISFWIGFFLFVLIGVGIMILSTFIGKKISKQKNGAGGGIIGFFLGVGFVFAMFFICGRLYVVTGDAEFTDYFVIGSAAYKVRTGETIPVSFEGEDKLVVINDWSKPVIVEEVIYGGYFSGDTYWVNPQEADYFQENRIFYFYDDEPPNEISVNSDNDEITRLWLRNKRD